MLFLLPLLPHAYIMDSNNSSNRMTTASAKDQQQALPPAPGIKPTNCSRLHPNKHAQLLAGKLAARHGGAAAAAP